MEKTVTIAVNFILSVLLGVAALIALTVIFQDTTLKIDVSVIDEHIDEHNEMIEAQREVPYLSTIDQ